MNFSLFQRFSYIFEEGKPMEVSRINVIFLVFTFEDPTTFTDIIKRNDAQMKKLSGRGWRFAVLGMNYEVEIEKREKDKQLKTKEELNVEEFCRKSCLPFLFVSNKLMRNVEEVFELAVKIHKVFIFPLIPIPRNSSYFNKKKGCSSKLGAL